MWGNETLLGTKGVGILLLYDRQEWCSMVQAWYLSTKQSQRGTESGRCRLCPVKESESHQIPSIVEMPRGSGVSGRAPETQIVEYQQGNNTGDDTHSKHCQ